MSLNKKKADCFIDGQNIFKTAKAVFGYNHPNFDVVKMCQLACNSNGWEVGKIYFYTGLPDEEKQPSWNAYWKNRVNHLESQGVICYTPKLQYIQKEYCDAHGNWQSFEQAHEKGVDVKIACDMLRSAMRGISAQIVFSRDNDLAVAIKEVQSMCDENNQRIDFLTAFPDSHGKLKAIEGVKCLRMDDQMYYSILDHTDYRNHDLDQRARRIESNSHEYDSRDNNQQRIDRANSALSYLSSEFNRSPR